MSHIAYSRYSDGLRAGLPGKGQETFLDSIHTGPGAHPASYPVGTRDDFPGGKAAKAYS
jgi:hypothetical protein